MKIIQPSNSPDLNIIERLWFWIKKETTRQGPTSNKKKLRVRQEKYWESISQYKIQEWIKAIPNYIKEVIRLKGGNEYKKGQKKGQEKIVIYYSQYIFTYY